MRYKDYRIKERRIVSLEGGVFIDYYIQERRIKWIGINIDIFWKSVIDESKTIMLDMSGNTDEYPYIFSTIKEAEDFIINKFIGKENYRNELIEKVLK